ncbi:hypothetical protein LEN26_015617 [Aphanomyces euteiches]|nr:hypothetical protein LEN26_015617 [Aphanomyces euteiches]KAH9128958.1 hypothetical protein AeMF1_000960 [Aphanomyces euteiches]KAH9184438.1 hypothetical protein AeNC1_013587 [Aphanomyces euteiches]
MVKWRATTLLGVVAVVLFLYEVSCMGKTTQVDLNQDVTVTLDEMSDHSAKLLYWNLRQYNSFIVNSTRQFGVAVLITAASPSYRCEVCGQLEADFKVVAQHYSRYRFNRSNPLPLYFAVLDADRIREFFLKHKISHVPLLGYFHPKSDDHTDSNFHLSAGDSLLGTTSILDYCNQMHKADIPRMVSIRRTFTISSFIALIFAAMAHYAHTNFDLLLDLFRNRWFWFCVSLAIYAFSISGALLCIFQPATETSPVGSNKASISSWLVHPNPTEQYVLEGLLATTLSCLFGWTLVYASRRSHPPSGASGPPGRSNSTQGGQGPLRHLHVTVQNCMLLAVLVYLVLALATLAELKIAEYSVWATLPPSWRHAWNQLYLSRYTNWIPHVVSLFQRWIAGY